MIDEKKLIYWIKCNCNPYGKPTLDYDTSIKIMDFIEKQKTKVGEWIPVSERLPKQNQTVIVTEDGEVKICTYELWYGYGYGFYGSRGKVTAWMPLPEPYKGETENVD